MSDSLVERQVERTRKRLARLRERAAREGHGPESLLYEAIEELGHTLEELTVSIEELACTNEELGAAQLAAERHARRYQDLFRFAPDAYVATDERGIILELNAVAEQKFGRSNRYLVGKPLLSLVAVPDHDRFLDYLSRLQRRRGRLVNWEICFEADPPFHASVSAVPELQEGEVEIRWILRNVGELRDLDAFRDQIERHLESVVWLYQLDPLRTLHVSPAYERVWGRPLASVYENPLDWIEGIHPEDRPRIEAAFERLVQGESFDADYRIVRPDGEVRWIHDRGTPFREARGRLDRAAGLAEDVTEAKATEAALAEAEKQRRAAAVAAELTEGRERRALANDLHDALGQSLALAQTKLAALRDEAAGSAQAVRVREIELLVAEAADRTRTLTFRLSPTILHDIGLVAAADWLAEDLLTRFGLHVHVSDAGLHEPLPFEPREALFRSLRELLINVARHARTDKAEVSLVKDGDVLVVCVADAGIGFDVKASGSAGFGLVSVRERVEALGGRLEIDSGLGRGTRVRLVVPIPRGS